MNEGTMVKRGMLQWRLVVVLLCCALSYGKTNPTATANYEKALENLKSGDLKIDFKALRLDCAASNHECQAGPDDIKTLYSLLKDKKFDQALSKVNQGLEKVFVDAELHYIAFVANAESGNKNIDQSRRKVEPCSRSKTMRKPAAVSDHPWHQKESANPCCCPRL